MKQVRHRSATTEYREKWVSNAYVTEAKRQLEHEHDDDDDDNSPRSVETFALTRKLMPERDRIAEMNLVPEDSESEEGQAPLRDVIAYVLMITEWHTGQTNILLIGNVLDVHKRS
jgi:hypothetical protein